MMESDAKTKEENDVKLIIFSDDFDADTVTERVGLMPTESLVKGSVKLIGPIGKEARIPIRHHAWILRSSKPKSVSIDAHLANIFEQIAPYTNAIKKLVETTTCEAELSIGQYYYHCNPGFHFTTEHLNKLAEIGAELDLDVYTLEEDET